LRADATPLQASAVIERRNEVLKKLRQFRQWQAVYMPELDRLSATEDGLMAEDLLVLLPSTLSSDIRDQRCVAGLADVEQQLRLGAAHDHLNNTRRGLRTRGPLNHFKIKNVTGVAANTQTQTTFRALNKRIKAAARRYNRARAALLLFEPGGSWTNELRHLEDKDLRAMNERAVADHECAGRAALRRELGLPVMDIDDQRDEEDDDFLVMESITVPAAAGESRRTLSWIWLTPGGAMAGAVDMGDCEFMS
jgi:hypothetical protein